MVKLMYLVEHTALLLGLGDFCNVLSISKRIVVSAKGRENMFIRYYTIYLHMFWENNQIVNV